MKSFQIFRDAAIDVPAPPTKNPSAALRLHAAASLATRHIHHPAPASACQSVKLPMRFLINGQNIRIRRNSLKTNISGHF